MSKVTYLVILGILSSGVFTNQYTKLIMTSDMMLIVVTLWGILGFAVFHSERKNKLNRSENRKYVSWFLLLMCLSALVPYLYFNQPILSTLVAQRANYLIFLLLTLLYIYPSEDEIIKSLKILTCFSIFVMALSVCMPDLFRDEKNIKYLIEIRRRGSLDMGVTMIGFSYLVFYFYYRLQFFFEKPDLKDLLVASLLMLVIIFVQNRSTIIGTLPFFVYAVFRMRSKYKVFFWSILIFSLLLILPMLSTLYDNLMKETTEQLTNNKYNRWQAVDFFLSEWDISIDTFLLGHGVPSAGSPYLHKLLRAQVERRAFISDIGLLGTFFYYGFLFMALFYFFICKALFSKRIPKYLKFFSLWVLLVPTLHGFALQSVTGMFYYSLFFYLVFYHLRGCARVNVKK